MVSLAKASPDGVIEIDGEAVDRAVRMDAEAELLSNFSAEAEIFGEAAIDDAIERHRHDLAIGIKADPYIRGRQLVAQFMNVALKRPTEQGSNRPLAAHTAVGPSVDAIMSGMARAYEKALIASGGEHPTITADRPLPHDLQQAYRKGLRDLRPFLAGLPKRAALLLAPWIERDIPPRDYILGNVLSTTSRWLIYGETGVGKTLLGFDIAAVAASGSGLLHWEGSGIRRKVIYLDGEMPAETFQERMKLVAERYGADIDLYGYNRDAMGDSDPIPPLNTPEGAAWLRQEIDLLKPAAIVYDSIMCLLTGSMSEEESWEPFKVTVRWVSQRRIAQIILHHTGHDTSKGFGTKTREWEMDTVISLTKFAQSDDHILMEFKKARLRKPETKEQFEPLTITCTEGGWETVDGAPGVKGAKGATKEESDAARMRGAFMAAYVHLSEAEVGPRRSLAPHKVTVDAIRKHLKTGGWLDCDAEGNISATSRTRFNRARETLIGASRGQQYVQSDGLIWAKPPKI